jgi:pimeloyl-ACP methyl ester carboxylesterase
MSAFSLGIIFTIVYAIFSLIIIYTFLSREAVSFYYPTYIVFAGIAILFALSLIFSKAGKRPWLRTAGISAFILYFILISMLIGTRIFDYNQIQGEMEKLGQFLSLIASILPLLFIMNFLGELGSLEKEKVKQIQTKTWIVIILFVGLIALGFTIFIGQKIVFESLEIIHEPDEAKRLAKLFEVRTYTNNKGDTMPYRILIPLNYDPQKKYPLVVGLHGGGVRGNDNNRHILAGGPWRVLSKKLNRKKYPVFIFVPQCPQGYTWGGYSNIPFMDQPAVDSLVFEIISELENEFSIDDKRLYVAGGSMGGYGTWHFICTRPKIFAAAIPTDGAGDPDLALKIINVPVWAFHSEKDQAVPVSGSRDMIEAIKKAGGNPRYTDYPK